MSCRWKTVRFRALSRTLIGAAAALAAIHAGADPLLSSERRGLGAQPLVGGGGTVVIDARKSLAVTDKVILSRFSLFETMDTLIARSGSPIRSFGDTSDLFRRWWDTQNDHAHLQFLDDAWLRHCDDPSFSSSFTPPFPYECPRAEGAEATAANDPFGRIIGAGRAGYFPVGLFNRFDLAAVDGADCGEYRIVFARNSGKVDGGNRNLIIFEAVLPNPAPGLGLMGCLPVAQFWHDLGTMSASARASALHGFYFDGLPGFSPVVHPDNYGAGPAGRGQIRTNQFMAPAPGSTAVQEWMLREFKLRRACPTPSSCELRVVPTTVKTNPFAELFGNAHMISAAFQADFVNNQVALLAEPDINRFNYFPPERFNALESPETGASDYAAQVGTLSAFKAAISAKLASIPGTTVTADDVIERALALSCAGCHQLSPGRSIGGGQPTWPATLRFTHVSEETEPGPDGDRFRISPALTNVFLPHRKLVLETFLDNAGVPGP